MPSADKVLFFLGDATLTLYPTDVDGKPLLNSAIWFGVCTENLEVVERWLARKTRPTARKYPRNHPLVPEYQITIGRVWAMRLEKAGDFIPPQYKLREFRPTRAAHVLDVLWTDEESGRWYRRTFYNVTIEERARRSNEVYEFKEQQVWNAEYFTEASGGGTPPDITSALPYVVSWVGTDGTLPLYTYSEVTQAYTEAEAGVSTGRATLLYVPDQGGRFEITFAGEAAPALRVTAGGVLEVGTFHAGVVPTSQFPRVEFLYGDARLAVVTKAKGLYAANIAGGAFVVDQPEQFQFYGGSLLRVGFKKSGVVFGEGAESL